MRKIELHAHTAETSHCGDMPGRVLIKQFKSAGYRLVVITDHIWANWLPKSPMEERVRRYLAGYRAAKAAGDELGVTVVLGMEARIERFGEEDFLIFGPEENDVAGMLELLDRAERVEELSEYVREKDWLIIQAHPFRRYLRAVDCALLDGVEVYNGNPRHDSSNAKAFEHARRGGVIMTSGSDAHRLEDVGRGGIMAPDWVVDSRSLIEYLRAVRVPERITTA